MKDYSLQTFVAVLLLQIINFYTDLNLGGERWNLQEFCEMLKTDEINQETTTTTKFHLDYLTIKLPFKSFIFHASNYFNLASSSSLESISVIFAIQTSVPVACFLEKKRKKKSIYGYPSLSEV